MPLPSSTVLFTHHIITLMRWEDQRGGRKTDGQPASLALLTYAHAWVTHTCLSHSGAATMSSDIDRFHSDIFN